MKTPTIIGLCLLLSSAAFGQPRFDVQKYSGKGLGITYPSADGLDVTANIYIAQDDKMRPFIVLCHQDGWSRGEYIEIGPKLNELGFNCMAIDQRSGGSVNSYQNETFLRAEDAGKETSFVDAEQDMIAGLQYARKNYAKGKVILWGSSYSAALALRIAGENPELVDGVMAFAPGEYFVSLGKPKDWITSSAKKINVPVFITSARNELVQWESMFDEIPSASKSKFVPESPGNHGSRAMWEEFEDSDDYWAAASSFLQPFRVD